jgi:ATP-dependent RNA helicase DeaD
MEATMARGYTLNPAAILGVRSVRRHDAGAHEQFVGGLVEHEAKEPASVTRGQNVLYVTPHDWASIAHFLTPALERVDESVSDVQVLVLTADAETAAAVAAAAVRIAGSRAITPLAATSSRRASRLLKARPSQLVAGTPDVLLSLVQGTTLKLASVKSVVLAWADTLVGSPAEASIETLMAEVPKEAARILVASEANPAVEALTERYARRARRVGGGSEDAGAPVNIEYVSTSAVGRSDVLRRLLDEVDPASALVYVRSEESEPAVRTLLLSLGYPADGTVRVARASGVDEVDVVVLYDVPATREELSEVIGTGPHRIIALVQPRQLATLRAIGGGGSLTPLTLPDAVVRARSREEAMRAELRDVLASGGYARELMALEPLLDDYDGVEVAAAALQLLERARAVRPLTAGAPADSRSAPSSGMARLFVNVGMKDNARPADLVGAIVNETGVAREAVGRIDIRDTHSLVEISSGAVEDVATKLTGTTIKGRRVQARVDQERPAHSGPPGRGADRPPRREGRSEGPRREGRSDAPRREGRFDRPRREGRSEGERHEGRGDRPRRPADRSGGTRGGAPRRDDVRGAPRRDERWNAE